jgi:hypothetical protein
VLRVSWVDSRFFDGRGLTTATLSVPIVRSCVGTLRPCDDSSIDSPVLPPLINAHLYTTQSQHKRVQAPDFAENPFRQASLALEHTWQLPWPAWLDSAGDRMRRRRQEQRRRAQPRTGTVLDDE